VRLRLITDYHETVLISAWESAEKASLALFRHEVDHDCCTMASRARPKGLSVRPSTLISWS